MTHHNTDKVTNPAENYGQSKEAKQIMAYIKLERTLRPARGKFVAAEARVGEFIKSYAASYAEGYAEAYAEYGQISNKSQSELQAKITNKLTLAQSLLEQGWRPAMVAQMTDVHLNTLQHLRPTIV